MADSRRSPQRDRRQADYPQHSTASPRKRSRSRSPGRHNGRPEPRPYYDNQKHTSAYRRRSPPKRRRLSPSPIRDSPPREDAANYHRPSGGRGRGRNILAEQEKLTAQMDQQRTQNTRQHGVQDISNQFYNARPEWVKERGREWRKNDSQIKGLRSYNNWVKSCMIHKFSPEEKTEPEEVGWGEVAREPEEQKPLLVLDIGCGKGGDLGKWQLSPQPIALYVGLDPAETSISQARERYQQMKRGRRPIFDARLEVQDCFGKWIGEQPIVREVGIDPHAGQPGSQLPRGRGFDVVSMMFSMHYAFENEERVRMMLRNVAGSLKKGGRFVGVVPNSDAIATKIREWYKTIAKSETPGDKKTSTPPPPPASTSTPTFASSPPLPSATIDGEPSPNPTPSNPTEPTPAPTPAPPLSSAPSFGNPLYTVKFPHRPVSPQIFPPLSAEDSSTFTTFRPPWGWKYTYWMAEAVDVPEFVVPWEAFRAVAEEFGLEQRYRKGFLEVWEEERGDRELGPLAVRMGVSRVIGGGEERLLMSDEEREAVGLYAAFCFVKV